MTHKCSCGRVYACLHVPEQKICLGCRDKRLGCPECRGQVPTTAQLDLWLIELTRDGRSARCVAARKGGSVLLVVLGTLVLLLALAAAMAAVSRNSLAVLRESKRTAWSYSAADSGLQVGISLTRSAPRARSFAEGFDRGFAVVEVVERAPYLYQITSTGTYEGLDATVDGYLKFFDTYTQESAVGVTFGPGTTLRGALDMQVKLDVDAKVSGKNHSPLGVPLPDPPGYGLASNGADIRVVGPGTVEGGVGAGADQFGLLSTIADSDADIALVGASILLDNTHIGAYGTPLAPVTVHVDLGVNGHMIMKNNFRGYGTIVIDTTDPQLRSGSVLNMVDAAAWVGFIIVRVRGIEADLEQTTIPIVLMESDAAVVGGVNLVLATQNVELTGESRLVELTGRARILRSAAIGGILVASYAELVSYIRR